MSRDNVINLDETMQVKRMETSKMRRLYCFIQKLIVQMNTRLIYYLSPLIIFVLNKKWPLKYDMKNKLPHDKGSSIYTIYVGVGV